MYIYIYIYGLKTLTNWDAQCRIDSRKLSHLLSGVRSTHGFLEDLEVWWDARLQATHLGKLKNISLTWILRPFGDDFP